jgi:pimeloyl-[acyl-carrier protein] methyl ester esterase
MSLHIETSGQGPNLILLHGWAMHSGIFAPLLPSLNQHFHVYCVDLPGHGQSLHSKLPLSYEAVCNELQQRIKQPAYIMGWSLGGLFALYAASKFPSHCLGLIMQNASPCFVHQADWPHGMPSNIFSQFANDLQSDYAQTLQRFFMLEAQGSPHLRDDLRLLQRTAFSYGEPSSRILCDGLQLLEGTDLRAELVSLNTPSLWLAGRRDRLVNPEAMQTASQLCQGQYQLLSHAGHAPFLTEPHIVTQHIVNFIRQHEQH